MASSIFKNSRMLARTTTRIVPSRTVMRSTNMMVPLKQFRPQLKLNNARSLSSNTAEVAVDKGVGIWLLGCGALVAGMVSIGGITRLTKSGLSIVDWKPTGRLPPMNEEQWMAAFEKYKQFPEWQQRQSMTLDEFKYIFWWEYGHRMLGRFVGVAFGVPMAYFLARGRIPSHLKPRVLALLGLGGAQGLVGAWMVQSGLEVDPKQRKEIRVSPYRLAAHLAMAFTTYSMLVWTALDVFYPNVAKVNAQMKVPSDILAKMGRVRGGALLTSGIVFTTALSGAFVAGNDAGNAFNTFPKMDGEWMPSEVFDISPSWRNLFENTALVQFDHRCFALASTSAVVATFAAAKSNKAVWTALPPKARAHMFGMLGMVGIQVTLGISTLLMYVPVHLAATHQFGSLLLLTVTSLAAHSMKGIPMSPLPFVLVGCATVGAPLALVMLNGNHDITKKEKVEVEEEKSIEK
jgi:heme a synthase